MHATCHKIVVLSTVLQECETWCITSREEYKLQVFENLVLGKISGPKKDEVNEQFSTLCNEELLNLYRSPSVVRILKSSRI
jgi:hypothetical protein